MAAGTVNRWIGITGQSFAATCARGTHCWTWARAAESFLLGLGHPYGNTAVTEAWPPNIRLCRQRLAPLGVRIFEVQEDAALPIQDSRFDIVINRHEAYDVDEVLRILKPGGLFITQQVGCQNNLELARWLNGGESPPRPEFSLETEAQRFKASGLNVLLGQECFPLLRFYDIGALVYWAKAIPWECPGFSVEGRLDILHALQAELERDGHVPGRQHRFVLVAGKAKV